MRLIRINASGQPARRSKADDPAGPKLDFDDIAHAADNADLYIVTQAEKIQAG